MPVFRPLPRLRFRRPWRLAAGAVALSLAVVQVAGAAAPEAQRAAFRQAYATASQGGDAWRAQAQGLQDYVLYPYLEAASLEHDIAQLDHGLVAGNAVRRHRRGGKQFAPRKVALG